MKTLNLSRFKKKKEWENNIFSRGKKSFSPSPSNGRGLVIKTIKVLASDDDGVVGSFLFPPDSSSGTRIRLLE